MKKILFVVCVLFLGGCNEVTLPLTNENEAKVIASYLVRRGSRLFVTSELHMIGGGEADTFTAPVGCYEAALETEAGVFFAAPNQMQVGPMNELKPQDGGIFIPKNYTAKTKAYFFTGKPPSVKRMADFWQNLYVVEGEAWHIENPAAPGFVPPKSWETSIREWVANYDSGKWQVMQRQDPVFRYAAPSGWFVSVTLCQAGADLSKEDPYPQLILCLVFEEDAISWYMETDRLTKSGRFVTVLPPDQLLWVALRKNGAPK